ncbi:MAG: sodium-dependent bicarbonate transport family permease [Phycisphaerales bacterium JB050]
MDLLLSPPILFFLLGAFASLVGSDLDIPKPVVRLLSLYLLMAIGTYGGYKLSLGGLDGRAWATLGASVVASFAMPFVSYGVLRRRLSAADAAAVAACYGSISAVTFITAVAFLEGDGIVYSGYMVASMALMESPAVVSGVLLARLAMGRKRESGPTVGDSVSEDGGGGLWREALLNGAVLVLVGSLVIGLLTGESGWASIKPLMYDPFKGVLCLFLLDMGLVAARRIGDIREAGWFLIAYSLIGAIAQGMVGVLVAWVLGLSAGDALLLAILFGSASYIAVPAAMRLAVPEANPSIYVTLTLAVTFPFNIILGIPMYHLLISGLGIGG